MSHIFSGAFKQCTAWLSVPFLNALMAFLLFHSLLTDLDRLESLLFYHIVKMNLPNHPYLLFLVLLSWSWNNSFPNVKSLSLMDWQQFKGINKTSIYPHKQIPKSNGQFQLQVFFHSPLGVINTQVYTDWWNFYIKIGESILQGQMPMYVRAFFMLKDLICKYFYYVVHLIRHLTVNDFIFTHAVCLILATILCTVPHLISCCSLWSSCTLHFTLNCLLAVLYLQGSLSQLPC